MSNCCSALFLALMLVSCANDKKSPESIEIDFLSNAQLESLLDTVDDLPPKTQIAIALIEADSVYFVGLRVGENGVDKVENRDSVFEIGSITKVMTSTILAQFSLNNLIQLTDSIGQFLDVAQAFQGITLTQLANHTSGLPRLPSNLNLMQDIENPYQAYNDTLLMEFLNKETVNQALTSDNYAYSNLGAGLLGYILSSRSKKQFEEVLQAQIFTPLEMNSTTTKKTKIQNYLVRNIDNRGNSIQNWDFQALAGAGAVFSSVYDLSKFMMAHLQSNDEALNLTRQTTFKVDEDLSLGLAWHIFKSKAGKTLFFHNGATGGYTSCLILDVDNKRGIVLLSNLAPLNSKSSRIDELAFMLIEE